MKHFFSSLLIFIFTCLSVINPSTALASQSQSTIIITKDNSQQMLSRALAGDQQVINAAHKLKAFQKTSVQEALEKINFKDAKQLTHKIDFDDGSSIEIGNGPASDLNTLSSIMTPSLTRTTTSITWNYYYKIYVAGIEWSRYTVFMKYWLCTDGSSVSLDMTGTYDSADNGPGMTLYKDGVTEVHTNDYYVQTRGQCQVVGTAGASYTVTLNCYGKYDWTKNWSQATIG